MSQPVNDGFWDLPVEERGYWYERAEEEMGRMFWDLTPEERGYYYELASGGNDAAT
jgi:hypothetical protein